jgi:hypothetical protein
VSSAAKVSARYIGVSLLSSNAMVGSNKTKINQKSEERMKITPKSRETFIDITEKKRRLE